MNSNFWKNKTVIVTGGYGFLGRHLVKLLKQADCSPFIFRSLDYNLCYSHHIRRMFHEAGEADILFHLAANVGGIGYNQENPYALFYDNAIMGIELIDESLGRVDKFVQVGTTCSYPKHCPEPFHEANFWEGYPEETNAAYGLAKKMLLVQLQAAKQQYGFNSIYPILTNLYGPGDNLDPEESHVVPSLIRKFSEAKEKNAQTVNLWGSGEVTRDFLHVEDAARALVIAAERHEKCEPLNIGSGSSIRISALAELIKNIIGYKGEILWDKSKPSGQPRRWLRTLDFWSDFDWIPEYSLEEGLRQTIKWYNYKIGKSAIMHKGKVK